MTQIIDRIQGLSGSSAFKVPVQAATTGDIILNGLQTVDGVALAAGDRVLVRAQTDAVDNGVYDVATSDWQRSLDFNGAGDVAEGTLVNVIGGSTNYGLWILSTASPVVGTSSLVFERFGGFEGSDQVAYVPAGAGAVQTTVQAKLRESVSVIDRGAVGDGVTDDTDAFEYADIKGGMVFLPHSLGYKLGTPVATTKAAWFPDPSMTWDQITGGGNLKMVRGRVTGGPNGANIWRFSDRVFIGEAAGAFAGSGTGTDLGNSWINETDYPGYLAINAQVLSTNFSGGGTVSSPYGFVSAVLTSNSGQGSIGFGSVAVTDNANAAWGYIAELQRESGATGACYGIEIAAKNKSTNNTITPNGQSSGVFGLWLAGGGDNAFGGIASNPSTAGIVFLKNAHTWNTGICFQKDSLTSGEAISLSSEGIGGAHAFNWYNAAGNAVFKVRSTATATDAWRLDHTNSGIDIIKAGKSVLNVNGPASSVNGLTIYGSIAGASPAIIASGDDSNIDINITPKGTGLVKFGTWTSNADVGVNGYVTIKDSAGNTRKLATIA